MTRLRRAASDILRRRRPGPVLALCIVMVVAQTLIRTWQVLPGAYWMDDLAYLWSARHDGLTWSYLFQPYNGSHLMPAGFLLDWAVGHVHSYWPAALVTILLQVLASLALLLLLRKALGDTAGMAVGFAVYVFNPLMIASVTWFAASTQTLPLQIAMCWVAYCQLRYQRREGRRWLVGALAGLVLGYAFWEKAIVVPVFAGLAFILFGERTWRGAWREFVRLWPAWAGYVAISAAYTVLYLRLADVGGASVRSVSDAVRFIRIQLLDLVLPSMIGGPWRSPGFDGTTWPVNSVAVRVMIVQVLIAVAVLGWYLRGRRSLVGWGVLAVYCAVTTAITLKGRGYWGEAVSLDPRYASDILPVAAVTLGFLLSGRRPDTPSWIARLRGRGPVLAFVTCLALLNSSMVTNSAMAELFHRHQVETYRDNVKAALAKDPDLVVFDGFLPGNIMIAWFKEKYRHVSSLLDTYGVRPRYDMATDHLMVLDDQGVPRPAEPVFGGKAVLSSPAHQCGASLDPGESVRVDLDTPVRVGNWVLRVDYFTAGEGAVSAHLDGADARFGVHLGGRSVFTMIKGGGSTVTLTREGGSGVLCVTSLVVGYPIPKMPS